MTVIELPDERAAALKAAARPLQTAADIVLDCLRDVPAEVIAAQPKDGASQHNHYIYGWPKREV
jgi:hypothetical protein